MGGQPHTPLRMQQKHKRGGGCVSSGGAGEPGMGGAAAPLYIHAVWGCKRGKGGKEISGLANMTFRIVAH